MRIFRLNFFLLLIIFSGLFSFGCYKTDYYTGNDVNLRFSTDTLVFDTVFTTIGSATRILKIFNDLDRPIELSSVYLDKKELSKFKLNIDGLSSNEATYIEIGPKDSIYVFGEVTIDPDEPISVSPFVIEDQIVFEVNGNIHKVVLEAWGQNANYLPGKFGKGKAYLTTCDLGVQNWDDDKPYVIYGTLLVDSCTIHIPEGTKVYIHGGYAKSDSGQEYNDGQIYFLKHGKLNIEGSFENPVVFQTDRLEHKYDDISGLWSGLYFLDGSSGNTINHAILKNANIGLYLDSLVDLKMSYTKILHNISAGIYARHASLEAYNCLIADSGGYGLYLRYGGNYSLDYCTVANYNNQNEALYMGNYNCLDYLCTEFVLNPINANFNNCIFYGNDEDELFFEDASSGDNNEFFNYQFRNCLVTVDELLDSDPFRGFFDHCENCINGAGEESLFLDIDNYNFHLDTLSIAIDKALILPGIDDDLDGIKRDNLPDIGCFEFVL